MIANLLLSVVGFLLTVNPTSAPSPDYKVLAPIRHGNLTVFPVVTAIAHDTREFLTLDEGLRSGEVVVTEAGRVSTMIRRPTPRAVPHYPIQEAQVNRLVLVNNSKRPLLLLAGEIVTGGKQDRVIAKDRLIAPESDPIDLDVFCVERGRWVQTSSKFDLLGTTMAAPAVRSKAMGDKDQAKVWAEVQKARTAALDGATAGGSAETGQLQGTTSYARIMENKAVQKQVESVAAPIESSYRSLMKELRDRSAVGVVVAVNGEIIWADIFASTDLLQKYWSKLVRSYAAEAFVARARSGEVSEKSAQSFLERAEGRRETVESEPGLYRHTEIAGDGFRAFELTTLLPKTGWNLHVAKIAA
jgi:hypothetical protein